MPVRIPLFNDNRKKKMIHALAGFAIGFLLVFAAFVTILDTAFRRVSFRRIQEITDTKRLKLWQALLARQDHVLSALYVAYGLAVLLASSGFAWFFLPRDGLGIALALMMVFSFVLVVLTRILPQAYAQKQDPLFALEGGLAIRLVSLLFYVPAAALNMAGTALAALWKNHFVRRSALVMTADMATLAERSEEAGRALDPLSMQQQAMRRRLEHYSAVTLGEVMVPLDQMEAVDGSLPIEELVRVVLDSGAGRMVLYQDHPENIVGILHTTLFAKAVALAGGDLNAVDVMSAVSEPFYVSPQVPVYDQISQFRQQRRNYALVRNREGVVIGGVSLNRLLKQLAQVLDGQQ